MNSRIPKRTCVKFRTCFARCACFFFILFEVIERSRRSQKSGRLVSTSVHLLLNFSIWLKRAPSQVRRALGPLASASASRSLSLSLALSRLLSRKDTSQRPPSMLNTHTKIYIHTCMNIRSTWEYNDIQCDICVCACAHMYKFV